ncbi:MAG TPA: hypothetical protein V6D47_03220 [Oscillatoriaceae cyanobacterium]
MSDRCTGHCCRLVAMPFSPDELQRMAQGETVRGFTPQLQEARTVADMLVPLASRYEDLTPEDQHLGRHFPETPYSPEERAQYHFYRCGRQDPVTGDCTRYDERPMMCRLHPYGQACPMRDCSASCRDAAIAAETYVRERDELLELLARRRSSQASESGGASSPAGA